MDTDEKEKGRSEILAYFDVRKVEVEVPEWNTYLHVRTLTGLERSRLVKQLQEAEKRGADPSVLVVIACACEPLGSLLFKPEDEAVLMGKSSLALDRVAKAAMAVNGFGPDQKKS